jgi:hypothetical protein
MMPCGHQLANQSVTTIFRITFGVTNKEWKNLILLCVLCGLNCCIYIDVLKEATVGIATINDRTAATIQRVNFATAE